jgi:hypothetical protein
MKSSKRIFRWAAVLLATGIVSLAQAQSKKDINQSCSDDKECESGHCVKTEDGEWKCCDCDQEKLDRLTAVKHDKCDNKSKGDLAYSDLTREFTKENELSLQRLNERRDMCRECLAARLDRENTCWDGGDPTHKDEIEKMKTATRYLDDVIDYQQRNKLGYSCSKDRYEDLVEEIDDECDEVDALFKRYVYDNPSDVYCSDIQKVLDECEDCREAWDNLKGDCYGDGMSDKRQKRFEEVKTMETLAKETLEKRKSDGTCK